MMVSKKRIVGKTFYKLVELEKVPCESIVCFLIWFEITSKVNKIKITKKKLTNFILNTLTLK